MKFSVGEIAILVKAKRYLDLVGQEVKIVSAGQELASDGDICDYFVMAADGRSGLCKENCLRKRPQKGIPQSVLAIFGHKAPA